jgi:hypothetical protein
MRLLSLLLVVSIGFAACGPANFPNDKDDDGDEFINSLDGCPNEPETINGFQDVDGCPDVRPADTFPTGAQGTWRGVNTLAVNGAAFSQAHEFTLVVNAERTKARLTGFCPGGDGDVEVTWSLGSATWSGTYICTNAQWGGCSRAGAIFFGLRVTPIGDGGMQLTGTGTGLFDDLDSTTTSRCDVPAGEMLSSMDATR